MSSASRPVSSLTSRVAACSGVSPGSTCPFGSASTSWPLAPRRVGTTTATRSSSRTTPPAENSRSEGPRLEDIPPEGLRLEHEDPAPALLDHARPLEHGEEARGRLAGGAGELRDLGLGDLEEHAALTVVALVVGGLGELREHARDPALHGLEGLPCEALVRLAQAAGQGDDELVGDVRVAAEQASHVAAEDRDGLELVRGLDGGRAALVVEHRELTEDVAGAEAREGQGAPVGVLAHHARVTRADDVAGVALVPLAEDDLVGLEAAGNGDGGDVAQVLGFEGLEHGDLREQADDVLPGDGHSPGYTVARMRPRVALVTCAEVPELDPDDRAVLEPLAARGLEAEAAVWDDPRVDWDAYDLALLRSPWDYARRRDAFVAWATSVPRLRNPASVVEDNTDKTYLGRLAAKGVPVVATEFISPGGTWPGAPAGEYVGKPAISAGSRDTARYGPGEEGRARAHVDGLTSVGRTAMVQPYVASVDARGETALLFFAGAFSHAIRKGPILE